MYILFYLHRLDRPLPATLSLRFKASLVFLHQSFKQGYELLPFLLDIGGNCLRGAPIISCSYKSRNTAIDIGGCDAPDDLQPLDGPLPRKRRKKSTSDFVCALTRSLPQITTERVS